MPIEQSIFGLFLAVHLPQRLAPHLPQTVIAGTGLENDRRRE
jgi:hypothetical protein